MEKILIISNADMNKLRSAGVKDLMQEFNMDTRNYTFEPTGTDVRYTAITAEEVQ